LAICAHISPVDTFDLWILHRQRHHEVDRRRHQDCRELQLPARVEHLRHRHGEQAADHLAARPPGVHAIEPFRLLAAVDRRDQRIDHPFDQPLRQSHDEEAGVEHRRAGVVEDRRDGGRWVGCEQDERDADEVADRREDVQRAQADAVNDGAADEDGDGEGPERRAPDRPHLVGVDLERAAHCGFDVATDGKDHRRGDQRNAAGNEQFSSLHRSSECALAAEA
jgi:hypothetical protein